MIETDTGVTSQHYQDNLLRREAGKDWSAGGLRVDLLDAIVRRERFIDEAVERHDGYGVLAAQDDGYLKILDEIKQIKKKYEIGDPPPLPTDVQK